MISLLLTIVIAVIVIGVLYWAIQALAGAFGLPPQITVVIQVLLVLVIVLWLLTHLWPALGRL